MPGAPEKAELSRCCTRSGTRQSPPCAQQAGKPLQCVHVYEGSSLSSDGQSDMAVVLNVSLIAVSLLCKPGQSPSSRPVAGQGSTLCGCRGLLFERFGQTDKALADFEEATALQPGNVEFLRNKGMCHRLRSEFDASIEAFSAVLALVPGDLVALSNRGWV